MAYVDQIIAEPELVLTPEELAAKLARKEAKRQKRAAKFAAMQAAEEAKAAKRSWDARGDGEDDEDYEVALNAKDGTVTTHRTQMEWENILRKYDGMAKPLNLGGHYVHEKEDKKHRMGDLLATSLEQYKKAKPGISFYEWLDGLPEFTRIQMVSSNSLMKIGNTSEGNVSPSMVRAFLKGVKYMDQADRRKHRVDFVGGTATQNGQPFTTRSMRTVFSGAGFGIWVMSPKANLYAGSHVKGMLHHSSFLAGRTVMCGGELYAENGRILFLSAKTGHYHANMRNLAWVLSVLQDSVTYFKEIKVLCWGSSGARASLVKASTVLKNFNDYEAWGELRPDEKAALQGRRWEEFSSI